MCVDFQYGQPARRRGCTTTFMSCGTVLCVIQHASVCWLGRDINVAVRIARARAVPRQMGCPAGEASNPPDSGTCFQEAGLGGGRRSGGGRVNRFFMIRKFFLASKEMDYYADYHFSGLAIRFTLHGCIFSKRTACQQHVPTPEPSCRFPRRGRPESP